jgi:hypothetical protein
LDSERLPNTPNQKLHLVLSYRIRFLSDLRLAEATKIGLPLLTGGQCGLVNF